MCDNDPLALSRTPFFWMRSESGPCGDVNQWRVEKLTPPSQTSLVFFLWRRLD